mmetsp:Transcript_21928/g.21635  ORF Transcript_21928/g.21635 Transcript_21928/m.21635 type:complete len:107 (-) Transcript_21928:18-338(-)
MNAFSPPVIVVSNGIDKNSNEKFKLPIPNRLNSNSSFEISPLNIHDNDNSRTIDIDVDSLNKTNSATYMYLIGRLCRCFVSINERNKIAPNSRSKYEISNCNLSGV